MQDDKVADIETKPTQYKTLNESETNTMVHQRLHGNRTTMSIRILPQVKEAFTKHTRELGLSTCHVAEGLFTGWLIGVGEKVDLVHQSPTINLTLVRDVKRVRRYSVEEISEETTEIQNNCCYCKKQGIGMFRFEPHNKDYPLCSDHAATFLKDKKWRISKETQELTQGGVAQR